MVVNFPLDTELDGFDGLSDLGAGNTIVFTTIPAGVNVYFAIDNNSQSKIQALQGMQIKTTHGGIYFTTIGTSSESMVLAHWASDDMEIITPPISTFESLNGFGLTAFNQLEKAMNPYNLPTTTKFSSSASVATNILSKTLNCDMIELTLTGGLAPTNGSVNGVISVYIDGVLSIQNGGYNSGMGGTPTNHIIKSVRGSLLEIICINSTTSYTCSCILQEFTLKA